MCAHVSPYALLYNQVKKYIQIQVTIHRSAYDHIYSHTTTYRKIDRNI